MDYKDIFEELNKIQDEPIFIEGVRKAGSTYLIDMTKDEIDDVIDTVVSDELYISKYKQNSYYFGYKLNDVSRQERSDFIKWLKSFNNINPSIEAFIVRPLIKLRRELGIIDFDLFIWPTSKRTKLTQWIIECYGSIMDWNTCTRSVNVIKNLPSKISFDYEKLKQDLNLNVDDKQFLDIKKYVDEILLPKIHNLDYFSISKNVKPKYRKYIKNFLTMDEDSKEIVKSIKKGYVLILDDLNTTGSTLDEILRVINMFNPDCKVFIFTLIGK